MRQNTGRVCKRKIVEFHSDPSIDCFRARLMKKPHFKRGDQQLWKKQSVASCFTAYGVV